ncbi:MAG: Ala-tRNA(Pro) hydrolase [Rhodospirillaceae bacterium]|nr:Ala-tRNA(Pro) hydrolase [Rhodospirillaceae bacterium]|tara:strand:+ start:877 stop:1641 length:765 start_codon:yes stop_codon:yes gene_type:complete
MARQVSASATQAVFSDNAYASNCQAIIVALNDLGGIILDRTVFFPTGGGQPGDSGVLRSNDGHSVEIATAVKGRSEDGGPDIIVHVPVEGQTALEPGTAVTAQIDWERRYRLMRVHTCLHLLSAVINYPVTGGQVSDGKGRLDFAIPESNLDKDALTERLNDLIAGDHPVAQDWITDAELDAQPDLVKTMSVKPPSGTGQVRLIRIEGQDLQPCGGTHVANTSEIGPVTVTKIENKGKQNRRVVIILNDTNSTD